MEQKKSLTTQCHKNRVSWENEEIYVKSINCLLVYTKLCKIEKKTPVKIFFFLLQNAYDALIFFLLRWQVSERNKNFFLLYSRTGRKIVFLRVVNEKTKNLYTIK